MAQGILHDFSDTSSCDVYEGDEGYIEIDFGLGAGPWLVLSDALAEHICTALGQLLTDRHIRRNATQDQLSEVIADQVERAELLADAQPASAADMTEGELILGRRVPRAPLCPHCFCFHAGDCG